jgi:hypothetical protein
MPKPSRNSRAIDQDFLKQLQAQAELQATLSTSRVLPKHIDWLTAYIGSHPWQTLVFLSTISTVFMIFGGRV